MGISKMDVINEICVIMRNELEQEQADQLKTLLIVKLHNFQYVEDETLPSTEVLDNDWLMKRFTIDMMAKGNSDSSTKQYLYIVRKFLDEMNVSYSQVTAQIVTDYLAIRQYRDKISPSYKVTIYKYIRAFFTWAYRKHHIDNDIVRDIDSIKAPQKAKVRLSDEEVERCRASVNNDARDNAILEVMLSTGVRVGELIGLNISDLDFQNGTIRIWGEKTNEYRTGFMTPRCKVALYAYLNGRTDGALFVGKRGCERITKGTAEKITKSIAERVGCNTKATVHVYRKTFASVTYRKTGDILLVSKLLGHASTEVTVKYYLIDDIEDMKYKMMKCA